jgi:hypothetical protein
MSKPQSGALGLDGFRSIYQTTPAGGVFASVRPNANKFKDVVDSSKASVHGETEVDRLFDDINNNATGAAEVSRREIMARLGALSNAELSVLVESMAPPVEKTVTTAYNSGKPSGPSKAVPATTFVKFRKLPKEIRIIIWTMALPDLIEAFPDFHMNAMQRFITAGPREAIFTICSDYQKMFYMFPIYLMHLDRDTDKEVEAIYIRPEHDILYLNIEALRELDIIAFTARPENQVIQNLALPAVQVERMRWCGRNLGRVSGTRTYVGDLVRGLKVSFQRTFASKIPKQNPFHTNLSIITESQEALRRRRSYYTC